MNYIHRFVLKKVNDLGWAISIKLIEWINFWESITKLEWIKVRESIICKEWNYEVGLVSELSNELYSSICIKKGEWFRVGD